MTNWVRARRPEQVSKREGAIVSAAIKVFKKEGYENASLNRIADEAGFTRSNIYRYFSSREEIYLGIYADLITVWSDELLSAYNELPDNVEIGRFAETWVNVTLKHKALLDLSPLLFISLERNSSEEQLEAFKKTAKELFNEHADSMRRFFPFLSNEDVRHCLTFSHALMASLWPASNPDTALAKVYRKKDFQNMKPDFAKDMAFGVSAIINGLKRDKEN